MTFTENATSKIDKKVFVVIPTRLRRRYPTEGAQKAVRPNRLVLEIPPKLRRRYGLKEGSPVIAEETPQGILIRPAVGMSLEPSEDELMLSLFLDFVTKQALLAPETELEAYTEAMAKEDEDLIAEVELDN
jgi:bifunctional DNA-binding transcriptional regulator/antitoxin component of YhaV-PrlF toxin-antitoxin module